MPVLRQIGRITTLNKRQLPHMRYIDGLRARPFPRCMECVTLVLIQRVTFYLASRLLSRSR